MIIFFITLMQINGVLKKQVLEKQVLKKQVLKKQVLKKKVLKKMLRKKCYADLLKKKLREQIRTCFFGVIARFFCFF